MQKPLVSILIPFKNTAQFLTACLESISGQSYENWEILAVDDHSEDTSHALLVAYALKDPRIKVFKNSGYGIIDALRLGYAKSTGQFITRMDSDDIMTSKKLMVMVHSLLKFGKGHLALGQVKYFSDRGIGNGYQRYEKWLNQLTSKGKNYEGIYKECVVPSPCWMAFREDFDSCGAFKSDRYPEDYDLCFRFRGQGLKCIPTDQLLHYWRDYDTRTSRTSAHYAQNYFLDLKLYYFMMQDHDKNRALVVWGAGKKGKTLAQKLVDANIEFTWLCDNPNKIGKTIYGLKMHHYTHLEKINNPQSIITVANEEVQQMIRKYLSTLEHTPNKDYFFFC